MPTDASCSALSLQQSNTKSRMIKPHQVFQGPPLAEFLETRRNRSMPCKSCEVISSVFFHHISNEKKWSRKRTFRSCRVVNWDSSLSTANFTTSSRLPQTHQRQTSRKPIVKSIYHLQLVLAPDAHNEFQGLFDYTQTRVVILSFSKRSLTRTNLCSLSSSRPIAD